MSAQFASGLTFDSWPDSASRERPRRRGVTLAVSIVAHAVMLAMASRVVWTRLEPETQLPIAGVWLGASRPPVRAADVEPPPAALRTPAPEPLQELPLPPIPEAAPSTPAPGPAVLERDDTVPTVRDAPQPPARTDWAEERRRAIADVLARQARDAEFSTSLVEQLMAPPPPSEEPRPARSIFDSRGSDSRRAFLQPGMAKTKLGRRVGELCNALTGGFDLFGFGSFCASPDSEPSGLFPEVMPEWRKLMPECEETRPLGPLLAESSEFPTVKCRLVPKEESQEPQSAR